MFSSHCLAAYAHCPSCRYKYYILREADLDFIEQLFVEIGQEMYTTGRCGVCPSQVKCLTLGIV
jgi:hypothetical protein